MLSEKEEELMNLIWKSDRPLTGLEMLQQPGMQEWNEVAIYRAIRVLQSRGLIRVCGVEQYKTKYARQFEAAVTKEEYAAQLLTDKGISKSSLAKIAMALVKLNKEEEGGTDELIEQLESIIDDLRRDKE